MNNILTRKRQMKATYRVSVSATNGNYGFGKDWIIVITKTINGQVENIRRFWVGQDAKVCSRIIGTDMKSLAIYLVKKYKTRNFANKRLNQSLGKMILRACGATPAIAYNKADDWSFAVH
jgi:hypothetical protein